MEPGTIVEFIESKRIMTGVIQRVKTGKMLVLSETEREIGLSANRILSHTGPTLKPDLSRADQMKAVREAAVRRKALAEELDLVEMWELLEGEGEEFSYRALAELALPGPTGPNEVSAVFRAVFDDGLYFKGRPDRAARHNAEQVELIRELREREQKLEEELTQGAAWLARIWADETPDPPPCRDHVIEVLKDMAVFGPNASEAKWGQQLLDRSGLGKDPLRPFELLVKMGEMHRNENLDLIRCQVNTVFPQQVLGETETLVQNATWLTEDRRDLTDLVTLTIDSRGSEDFDDAVSLSEEDGRLVLGVHITDVAALVRPESLLELEARARATSIYMTDRRITMLPAQIVDEALSLREGEVRPALSVLIRIQPDGTVEDFKFCSSLIRVKRQLSYSEVDENVHQDPVLSRLHELSLALQKQREAHGALVVPLPTLAVYLQADGQIGVSLIQWNQPGRAMVTEFMILANQLGARFLAEAEAPALYRYQDAPSQRLIEGPLSEADLFSCLLQRRYFSRVGWGLDPKPHSGLGVGLYTNLTSPLRRYIDLLMQRQIKRVARGEAPFYNAEEMSLRLMEIEPVLKRAYEVQTRRKRYWLYRYLEGQGPKEYEALVLHKLPHRWRIFIRTLMLETDLANGRNRNLEPGQEVRLRLKKVDARRDVLRFDLA